MATIKEYLKYYKSLTFSECKLNINDVLLFTELSYIDWHNIVPEDNNKITLKEAFNIYQKTKNVYLSTFMKGNIANLKDIYTSTRYKDIYLSNYKEYVDNEKQFGALKVHFDNKVFISYKGTNGTIIGWKEDFTLGYHFPIISQKYAINYLNEVITSEDKEIYIGGHSKGGNLAMTSSMYCNNDIFKRIKTIYNLDGPGFREKDLNDNFKKILPKLQIYIPEDSIIGMLLYSTNNKKIVKSNTSGIMTHDINTWLCFGQFLENGKNYLEIKNTISVDSKSKIEYQLGILSRKICSITNDSFFLPSSPEKKFYSNYEFVSYLFHLLIEDASKANIELSNDTYKTISDIIDENEKSLNNILNLCLCHTDIWDGNILVEDSKITGIVDFSDLYFCDELMTFYFHTIDGKISNNFLAGFQKINLNRDEKIRIEIYRMYVILKMIVDCGLKQYGKFSWMYENLDNRIKILKKLK